MKNKAKRLFIENNNNKQEGIQTYRVYRNSRHFLEIIQECGFSTTNVPFNRDNKGFLNSTMG